MNNFMYANTVADKKFVNNMTENKVENAINYIPKIKNPQFQFQIIINIIKRFLAESGSSNEHATEYTNAFKFISVI